MTDAELEALVAGVSKSGEMAEAYRALENAATLLIGEMTWRHPGEELKDPFILYLDKALSELEALKNKP
jgi:hypothetical protein